VVRDSGITAAERILKTKIKIKITRGQTTKEVRIYLSNY
jgi:hypothetical protein